MPTYAYRCDCCSHEADLRAVKVEDRNKRWRCPECPEGLMERVSTAGAIHFRGSGWTEKVKGRRG